MTPKPPLLTEVVTTIVVKQRPGVPGQAQPRITSTRLEATWEVDPAARWIEPVQSLSEDGLEFDVDSIMATYLDGEPDYVELSGRRAGDDWRRGSWYGPRSDWKGCPPKVLVLLGMFRTDGWREAIK
ncbi:hypothetical protein BJD55_gp136 [Gordonia phage Yvonnetastic]|uniref:Uncharacterized protein n=1 Tax=Gordonia phage Yvonnetastic TaxID=1821566 RepID=A0A142K947_9CAUD|nr:hypothetical protein BJD55_gp136 [Gordonia phage Yvonnetastic]AMS02630.1 hypothetical protein SEA_YVONNETASTIC_86 [Gordonia phage Yvonnetastic]